MKPKITGQHMTGQGKRRIQVNDRVFRQGERHVWVVKLVTEYKAFCIPEKREFGSGRWFERSVLWLANKQVVDAADLILPSVSGNIDGAFGGGVVITTIEDGDKSGRINKPCK